MNVTPNEPPRPLTAAAIKKILPHRYTYNAQTGAVAALSLPENHGKLSLFGGVKNARFRRQVVPGDVLILECELIEQHGPVGIGKATAWVDGVCAANAELTFVIADA